ncbi:MAG: RDD family protein [Gemella sp.]|nr:RDD family protein [Gemella sp.]
MEEKKDLTLEQVKENITEETKPVIEKIEEKEETSSNVKLEEIKQEIPKVEEKKIITSLEDYKLLAKNFYAGFGRRWLAYIVDLLVVGALSSLFSLATFGLFETRSLPVVDVSLATILVYLLYFAIMTYKYSQTLGKMILGIKVETNTGIRLGLTDIFFREIVGRFINTATFNLPYLVIFFNSKKKGLHDYIADTVVVKEEYTELRRKVNESLRN